MRLVIGTRGSALAMWQARHVRQRLLDDPGNGVDEVELQIIKTRGDKIQDVALAKVGGKGLFVKEIEEALLDRRIDLAVHSMKDVPSELPEGLSIACVPAREDPRDALVLPASVGQGTYDDIPEGATVGTASLRRMCQLLAVRPDLKVITIRGNVDTRLRKLDEGVDGIKATFLACAGLRRLGWADRISRALPPEEMLPAVGQGALGIETRDDHTKVNEALARLACADTRDAVAAERSFLLTVEGSCQIPVGAHGKIAGDGETLELAGFVGKPDGSEILRDATSGPRGEAAKLGESLARSLLDAGGRSILAELLQ